MYVRTYPSYIYTLLHYGSIIHFFVPMISCIISIHLQVARSVRFCRYACTHKYICSRLCMTLMLQKDCQTYIPGLHAVKLFSGIHELTTQRDGMSPSAPQGRCTSSPSPCWCSLPRSHCTAEPGSCRDSSHRLLPSPLTWGRSQRTSGGVQDLWCSVGEGVIWYALQGKGEEKKIRRVASSKEVALGRKEGGHLFTVNSL